MERRMAGLGRDWRGVVEGDMIKKMEELLRTDNTEGLGKVDNSTYCPYYRHLKTDISGEEYLYDGTKDEEKMKLWARARCGSIWYDGVKTVEVVRCAEGADKRRTMPRMQKTAKSLKKG